MAYNKSKNKSVEDFLDILYSYDFERKEKTLNAFRRHVSSSYVFPKAIKGKELTKINVYDVWIEFRLSVYSRGSALCDAMAVLFMMDLDINIGLSLNYVTEGYPNGYTKGLGTPLESALLIGCRRDVKDEINIGDIIT